MHLSIHCFCLVIVRIWRYSYSIIYILLLSFKVRTSFPPTLPVDDTQIIVVTATVSSELEKKVNMVVPVSAHLV